MPTLDWIGKKAVVNHHKEVPFHLLRCDPDLSVGDPESGNLLVQGDNLLALKALLPYYAGQVKCIYIDPPYNTGNEKWVYNDNVNSPEIKEWLGDVVGKEAEDLSRHDKWLCMMYPRLQLLKKFLKQDGVILVSIDDFEAHRLRILMDEIFGTTNFIAQLVWDKTRKNDSKLFSVGHEYILVYARSLAFLRQNKTTWRESKPGADTVRTKYYELKEQYGEDFTRMTKELRAWYTSLPKESPAKKLSRHKHIDANGIWRDRDISWPGGGGPRYDVIHPDTKKPCVVPERGWGFSSPETMQNEIDKGLVVFRKDHTTPPIRKAYLFQIDNDGKNEDKTVGAQVMPSVIHKQSQVVVKFLRNVFDGEKVFENPKDHEVLMRLIKYVTGPEDIIFDSFAGSGSTGHAVLQANKETGGNRRFVLIEMDQSISQNVTCKRLQKAVEGYSYTEKKQTKVMAGLGSGFQYCNLGETLFNSMGQVAKTVSFIDLARFVFFKETGLPLPDEISGKSPLIGIHNDIAVYLLYNGILKDKTPDGGNALTRAVLDVLPPHDGLKTVYGTT
ncbi:MAG: site-specific DNA-methyltransferase, partial [Candidatus Electrothrix sp. AUS4]|nr:site-specific DNA-methyltransferase [Candidatus Electrothrix sp. AUS4]